MSNTTHRTKFEKLDNQIWKKTPVDAQGRITLPKKLRQKLGLNGHSSILWISASHKNGKSNEFLIEVGIKNQKGV